jgi:hypothetical protein
MKVVIPAPAKGGAGLRSVEKPVSRQALGVGAVITDLI